MSGYSIGRDTLYSEIIQLLPGEFCILDKKEIIFKSYHTFIKKERSHNFSINSLSNKLTNLTLSILKKIKEKYIDTTIVVPLSAGYDSRLIASGLKYLDTKNVLCFSYGRANNFEAKVAKNIANKIGYDWFFVELGGKKQKANFNSVNYAKYKSYSETLSSWSYVQDFFAVEELIKNGIIDKKFVIINGNTGDFISGGHLPKLKSLKKESLGNKLEEILQYTIEKHFALWENYFSEESLKEIKKLIVSSIPKEILDISQGQEHKIYEYIEFINRQSNYVIQGQRVYDFYGLKWELPMWNEDYLNFWNKVPYKLKFNQKLYKYMLFKNDWAGVWNNIPVNDIYIKPTYINFLRNFLKIFFMLKKRKKWHSFDKKFISYFIEIVPHYTYFNYFEIIKSSKVARNALAWHVEEYLKLKGFNNVKKK